MYFPEAPPAAFLISRRQLAWRVAASKESPARSVLQFSVVFISPGPSFLSELSRVLPRLVNSTYCTHCTPLHRTTPPPQPVQLATAMTGKTILVLGAGPGIGRCVASIFASKRYNNVVLVARRAEMLQIERKALQASAGHGVNIKTYAIDTTNTADLLTALNDADAAFGKPEVVFYNAARVLPSELFVHPVEDIEYDLKINVSALYVVSQRYMPHLVSLAKEDLSARPALIVTSSALPQHPIPGMVSGLLVASHASSPCVLEGQRQVF